MITVYLILVYEVNDGDSETGTGELHIQVRSVVQTEAFDVDYLPLTLRDGVCCVKCQFKFADSSEGRTSIRRRWEVDIAK